MAITLNMSEKLKFRDPPRNWALGLAKRLESGNPLDQQVAIRLVGRPHRYTELVPLVGKRGKNNLTQALRRLQADGIVQMRTNFRATPRYDYYELTSLGVRAVLALAGREYLDYIASRAQDSGGQPTPA